MRNASSRGDARSVPTAAILERPYRAVTPGMLSDRRRAVQVVAIMALSATLFLAIVFAYGSLMGGSTAVPATPIATFMAAPVLAGSPASEASDALLAERLDVSAACLVTVETEGGTCLGGVMAFPGDQGRLVLDPTMVPISKSGPTGVLVLSRLDIPASRSVLLWKYGYSPQVLEDVVVDTTRVAVMRPAHSALIMVQNETGAPIPGFRVMITRVDPSVAAYAPDEVRPYLALRSSDAGGASFFGTSDVAGRVNVEGLGVGSFSLECNIGKAAVTVVNAPTVMEIPGEDVLVVVRENWASAVEFIGDDIVARSNPVLGRDAVFSSPSSALDSLVVEKATDQLRHRFPAATIIVGCPRPAAIASGVYQIQVYGRRTGWTRQTIPLCPVSELRAPYVVVLHGSGSDMSAVVSVVATDSRDVPLQLPGGLALLEFTHGECMSWLRVSFGDKITVPATTMSVFPCGELPPTAFPRTEVELEPGQVVEVRVRVGDLQRYALAVTLPGNTAPGRWGLRLGGDCGRFVSPREQTYHFYSAANSVPYRVYVQGYSSRGGVVENGHGDRSNGAVQSFNVAFEQSGLRK